MPARRVPIATLVAGGLLAGGVAAAGALNAAGALAVDGSSTPAAAYSTSGAPGGPEAAGTAGPDRRDHSGERRGHGFGLPGMGMAGRMLHGEVVVAKPTGGTETLLIQSGTITAASSNSITVKSSDGFTLAWSLGSGTTVRTGPRTGTTQDLAKGDTVEVVGTKSGSGGIARFVGERPRGRPQGVPDSRRGVPGGPGHRPLDGPGHRLPGGGPSGTPSGPTSSGALFGSA